MLHLRMECADCHYILSAFDKDCPRCAKYGKPVVKRAVGNDPPPPIVTSPSVISGPDTKRPSASPLLFVIGAVVTAMLIAAFVYSNKVSKENEIARLLQVAKSEAAAKLSSDRREGYNQCVAGDSEGCHYYMDKLRDEGDATETEYLKASLIVAQYLARDEFMVTELPDFQASKFDAKHLQNISVSAAFEGNKSAMDAAGYLSDAGGQPAVLAKFR
jgi:hypothetical protein